MKTPRSLPALSQSALTHCGQFLRKTNLLALVFAVLTLLLAAGTSHAQFTNGPFTILHSFSSGASDGGQPYGSLTVSGNTFYGMSGNGGSSNHGTVFKVNMDGSGLTVLHSFAGDGLGGHEPDANVTLSGDTLYGMTCFGGGGYGGGGGTVFKVKIDGTGFTVLHAFDGTIANGYRPDGSLTLSNGKLYGMTYADLFAISQIFSVNTDGSGYTILHTFAGYPSDGYSGPGSLTLLNGALYGMTYEGGASAYNNGTIFKMNIDGSGFTILHSFFGGVADGGNPFGSLTLSGGAFYGMTTMGGTRNQGTVFKINVDGSGFALLHSFDNTFATDGYNPDGSLILSGSTLYGMTLFGGTGGRGTVFSVNTDGSGFTVMHPFTSSAGDGAGPYGDLTLLNGALYGMTPFGGADGAGTLFRLGTVTPGTGHSTFYVQTYEGNSRLFTIDPDSGTSTFIGSTGVSYMTDLAMASDGSLFGITFDSLYSVDPATGAATQIGSLGVSGMVGLDFASDGQLYAVQQGGGGFFRIDRTTGVATLLFPTPYSYVGDVTHSSGNVFYATANFGDGSHLIEIDASNGTSIDRGLIAAGEVIPGLDFDASGRLIAFAFSGKVYSIPNFTSSGSGVLLSTSTVPIAGATLLPSAMATETPTITSGLPADGGIFLGTPVPGQPGVVRGTISGTGHPGCTIQLTASDPHPPFDTDTFTTTVDASGHWSFELELDDCDPIIEIVQICDGVASAPVRRHVYVDGTPPVFTAGGPGDGFSFSSGGPGGGTATVILNGSATDSGTSVPGGGVSYEWHLLGGGGSFTVLGGGGSGGTLINGGTGLNISLAPGEYDFEVIVTDAAGNKLRKRCHRSVHIPPAITSGMPDDGGIYGPGTPGSPGHVRRTITGTGHPGCTIQLTVTDARLPNDANNNRTLSTVIDPTGHWSIDLDLDDCDPVVDVIEICDGAASPSIRRQIFVDGTPPFFLDGGGPGDGVDYVGGGGTGLIVLGGGAGDRTLVPGGGVGYQWFLIGGDGITRTPVGDGTGTLRLAKGLGDYVIEEVVTDAAGNKRVKRCARSVIRRTCWVQIPDAVVYYNESVALTGQVFDTIAQPNQIVPNAPLGFTVNGVPVANPAAYLATLKPGPYPIGATFPENGEYQSATATATLTVLRRPTDVTTANVQVPYGTQVTLTGSLSDVRLGGPLTGRPLGFKVNGQPVTNPFEASLPPGSYPIVVNYAGDNYYVPSTGAATLTILSTPGKITGGGSIDQSVRNFGFVVQTKVQGNTQSFAGNLQYQDKALGYNLKATVITGIAIAPDRVHGIFTGPATMNGVAGYTFVAWIEDWAEPGAQKDKFRITISGPGGFNYDSAQVATKGGILDQGGNIQIHKP